jgi:hypothetical protein
MTGKKNNLCLLFRRTNIKNRRLFFIRTRIIDRHYNKNLRVTVNQFSTSLDATTRRSDWQFSVGRCVHVVNRCFNRLTILKDYFGMEEYFIKSLYFPVKLFFL